MANDLAKYKKLTIVQEKDGQLKCDKIKYDKSFCKLYMLAIICLIFLLSVFLFVKFTENWRETFVFYPLEFNESLTLDQCQMQLVESIPEGLVYAPGSPLFMSTFAAWSTLLNLTTFNLNIGSFYWTLRGEDVIKHPSAAKGEEIYARLLANAVNGSTKNLIRIARSVPSSASEEQDTIELMKQGAADVRVIDFPRLLGGVLHTKIWIVDNKHFYIGSANMDWRALTQVKELGVLATNCPALAQDLNKIFNAYWYLGINSSKIPVSWPEEYATNINVKHPLLVQYNNKQFNMWTYFASSPPPLTANGRTNDLDAILNTIHSAKYFINIAVMDYMPLQVYTKPIKYWPYIDDALRTAAIDRGVRVKMLISWWKHSSTLEDYFLRSLVSLNDLKPNVDIQIKRFIVPGNEDQKRIPYGRVNHNKYMVTDNIAYIGTSNWEGDYFIDTAGVGLVLRDVQLKHHQVHSTIRSDLKTVFQRDWDSKYATSL